MRKQLLTLILCFICTTALAAQRVEIPPATFILNGQSTVTTAGTQVQLNSTSTGVVTVSIKALSTNTGVIYVGDSNVSSSNGRELQIGESIDIDIANLNLIYIDSSVNGEGVSYVAVR
jgi:hypothetical protein